MNTDQALMCALTAEELSAALVGKTIVEVRPCEEEYWPGSRELILSDGTILLFIHDVAYYYLNSYWPTIITPHHGSPQ